MARRTSSADRSPWSRRIRSRRLLRLAAAAVAGAALLAPARARAQAAGIELGRYFEGDDWTTFRVGLERPLLGPLSATLYGTHLRASSALGDRLWGAGADLALFRGARQGPYLVGGIAGGFATQASRDLWGSWSAGAGYQVVPLRFLSLGAEARWRELTPGARDGLELSLRLAAVFGGRSSGAPVPLATAGRFGAAAALADSVVATAAAAMGTAYRLGGTTTDGFDCSGLIQYAYGRYGIALPRTSAEQAGAGEEVARQLDALRPGDILTFSNAGGPVTHVGLYVGDGRFIHSATRGVQLSRLSDDDPYGRWWWERWVGARRMVKGEE